MVSSPGRLHRVPRGCGHENRVYLSRTSVVHIMLVFLSQGMD
jgi:hypothetical protein